MGHWLKSVGSLISKAISGYQKHNAGRMAAAIAFDGILSIAPLGVILVTVAGSIYGRDAAEGLIVGQLSGAVGNEAASALQGVLRAAYVSSATVPATIVAFIVLIWSATRLIGRVRESLNNIWEVKGRGGGGLKGWLVGKAVDIVSVFFLAGLLLGTMLAQAVSNTVSHYFADRLPFGGIVLLVSGVIFSLLVAMVVFMIIFRWLPNLDLGWREVVFGGALTSILFTFGNYILGLYLSRTSPGSVFGAAGSFVVIMLWMNYSALMVLFGAEVTRARWERRHGRTPDDLVPEGKQMSEA